MNSNEKFIVGNWKMNKTPTETKKILSELIPLVKSSKHKIMIAPTYVCLTDAAKVLSGSNIKLAAQDVSAHSSGAYTGEVSINMLKDIGVSAVILGHSERRQYHNETDKLINLKLKAVLDASMIGIICVGETLEQRDADQAFSVVSNQIKVSLAEIPAGSASKLVIAYEPVWAIGTGKTASSSQVEEMHFYIRGILTTLFSQNIASNIFIQYGGSVKPDNVKELMSMPNINGALVGGASLDVKSFSSLINF